MSNKNHIAYGVTAALIQFVLSLVFYFTKLNQERWTGFLSLAILMIAVILSCINYGKTNPGQTFGNIFANGFKTTAVITVIGLVLTVIFILIFPDIKEQGLEAARAQMEADGKMTAEQIDGIIEKTDKSFWVLTFSGVIIGSLIFGLVASLIGAAVAPKAKK
ncbi:DUF4199 domain-containing protein [Chitinophaga sp. CB10]|uniref:DUF4199 domain-containing protein n=1 Tax=Chitinophaga sp. CB10 TaxID=1891659 RepID=UPI0025C53643|nr:DUF4199 domain-containing protein [Chitinophaga sp. CB10]